MKSSPALAVPLVALQRTVVRPDGTVRFTTNTAAIELSVVTIDRASKAIVLTAGAGFGGAAGGMKTSGFISV